MTTHALRTTLGYARAHARCTVARAPVPDAPLEFAGVERHVRALAAPAVDPATLELLSIARAADGGVVTLDCATSRAAGDDDLLAAADQIAAHLDPHLLGAAPGAAVRVVFVRA